MKNSQAYEWLKRFHEGPVNVEDDFRCGHPSAATTDENIQQVHHVVHANSRISPVILGFICKKIPSELNFVQDIPLLCCFNDNLKNRN